MQAILITLFIIWVIGTVVITNKHSEETFFSILKLKPTQTTLKGWIYLILWGVFMFFIMGTLGMLAGY